MDCIIINTLFCLVDSVTSHTILKNYKLFNELVLNTRKVSILTELTQKIEGSGRAYIMLPNSTHVLIKDHYFQVVLEETRLVLMGILLL